MAGYEVYCAFCGAPFSGNALASPYDRARFPQDTTRLNWITRAGVISEIPAFLGPNPLVRGVRVWNSDNVSHNQYDSFTVRDPGPPWDTERDIPTYNLEGDGLLAVPYHADCHELFYQYINRYTSPQRTPVNAKKLMRALRRYTNGHGRSQALPIDYGDIAPCMATGFWNGTRGDEWFLWSPTNVPELTKYYRNLPRRRVECERRSSNKPEASSSDPFSPLPTEVLLALASHVDIVSLGSLMAASRAFFNLERLNSWWRLKLLGDMTWLYDFVPFPRDPDVDWAQAYRDLWLASGKNPEHAKHGLANRRRIWEHILPQIGREYSSKSKVVQVPKPSRNTRSARLVYPEPGSAQVTSTRGIAPSHSGSVYSVNTLLTAYFNDAGTICGVTFLNNEQRKEPVFDFPTTTQTVAIPEHDRLMGFLITTRASADNVTRTVVGLRAHFEKAERHQLGSSNGDQRLIHVSDYYYVVGLETVGARDGILSRLSLIEEPIGQDARIGYYDLEFGHTRTVSNYLWRGQYPPPGFNVSPHDGMSWVYVSHDLRALELLVLGESDEELAGITAIAADVQFGGFEVQFRNQPSRTIGPRRLAMKTMKIDGAGGERIATMHHSFQGLPIGLRLVTNWGRQLIIGGNGGFSETCYPQTSNGFRVPCLTGLYGWWSHRGLPHARLQAIGCVDAAHLGSTPPSELTEFSRDVEGMQWLRSPLPASLLESGPLFGKYDASRSEASSRVVPRDYHTMEWLDCSRPLQELRVTMCHSTKHRQLPLSAISVRYADGEMEEASVGPDRFAPATDETTDNGHPWCWCHFGDSFDDEVAERPHNWHETWTLDGKRLRSVRMRLTEFKWPARGSCLTGIQFVAEDGSVSPEWSHWVRPRSPEHITEEISFMGSNRDAAGLKFVIGNNDREKPHGDDPIILAVRAIKRRDA